MLKIVIDAENCSNFRCDLKSAKIIKNDEYIQKSSLNDKFKYFVKTFTHLKQKTENNLS